ncbi:cysteine hydrolase [bacterium]|nr:cysteine hydrolase [bacterium]
MGRSALLVIDMLNDFVHPNGALYAPSTREIITNIKKKIEEARGKGWLVIYICDSHRPDDNEFLIFPPHCIEGSWGAEVIDELKPKENDYIVKKRRYSGFFGTDLELLLRENKVEELHLTGCLTDICVLFTCADAYYRGFKIYISKGSTAALSFEDHEYALKLMKKAFGVEVED